MQYIPSLACANPLTLGADIEQLMRSGMNTLHVDIMDGHYVPNICLSFDTAESIHQAYSNVIMDVHLMTEEPEKYIERLKAAGAAYVTFHNSATHFSYRTISAIHSAGMKAGIALNPSQPVGDITDLLPYVDLVLVMSIEPGFSGQSFIWHSLERITALDRLRRERKLDFQISVDGGITAEIALELQRRGADWIIMGYPTIFRQPDGIERSFARFCRTMNQI